MKRARERMRSRSPPRVAPPSPGPDVYCLRVMEMERASPGGPRVCREWPDLYGPSEHSLRDWYNHALAGRECLFWGQWEHMAFLHRIIHGHGEAGVVTQVVSYSDYGDAGELGNWIW